jgi:peptide/nickel transport system substrate-binding protein
MPGPRSHYSQRGIGRRSLLGATVASAFGMAGLAAGCGDDDDDESPGSSATAGTTQAPAGQPKRGGVWRGVMAGDPTNLDPFAGTAFTTAYATAFAYSRLVRFSSGPGIDPALYKPEPDLAESIAVSDDGLTYTVKLRANAKWHAPVSRPVDADDVVFSWKRFTGQISGTPGHADADAMNEYLGAVEKVDNTTVAFRMKQTRGDFLVSEDR